MFRETESFRQMLEDNCFQLEIEHHDLRIGTTTCTQAYGQIISHNITRHMFLVLELDVPNNKCSTS